MNRFRALWTLSALAVAPMALANWDKVEPDLRDVVSRSNGTVDVVFFLRRQHAAEAAAQLRPHFEPRLAQLGEELRRQALAERQMPSLDREGEKRFREDYLRRADLGALKPIGAQIDRTRQEFGDAIVTRAKATALLDFLAAESQIKAQKGQILGETLFVSAVVARIPASSVRALASSPMFATVSLAHGADKELDVSAQAMLASSFWNANVTGGPQDVGVLDTGSLKSHTAFAGFRWEGNTTDADGHGTHVTGIMASKNTTYRGMAWGADTISVASTSSEAQSMVGLNTLMTAITERAENVNHSFGYGTANGTDYRNTDQFFDGACDNFQIMVSKSTGNNGYGTTTITHPAPAYNLIAVASINDLGTPARTDDRISSFSSSGPTLSGRKKPDITSPGQSIMSTYNNGNYSSLSGTSMAAPHAGGSIVLLMAAGTPSPMAAKAVLINSADAMNSNNTASTADDTFVNGSRWDKAYGWGYVNLATAFLHAPDVFQRSLNSPNGGPRQYKLFRGFMRVFEKATLTWNRHVAWNGSSYPTIIRQLSNLDLYFYGFPGVVASASSTSTIDNVEQIGAPFDGVCVLKVVTNGNFDANVATENFALATEEGFVEATGPVVGAGWVKNPSSTYTTPFVLSVDLTNTGDLPVNGATCLLQNYTVVNGANPANVGNIQPGQTVRATWTVQRQLGSSQLKGRVVVNGTAYEEPFSWTLTDPGAY